MAGAGNHEISVNFRSGDMESRFRSIEQGILSTGRSADRLQQQFNRTSQSTDVYGRSAQKAARSTTESGTAMGRSAREAGNLTQHITKLTGATNAQDRAQSSLTTGLSRMQSLIGPLVGAFLSLSVVISGLTGSVRIFAEFQATMSAVRAVSQGTEADMMKLTGVAKDLGATTMFSATQAAQGMQLLGQAGFNAGQIIETMPGLLDLAASGELDLASAADIASSTLKGFALAADQATRVADALALAAASTNTSVGGLGEGMKYVAPVAASLNISLEDTTAALGTLADAGFQGTMAGTGLRRILGDLINPTKEARSEFARLKIDLDQINPATTRLVDIVDKLAKSNLDAASANKIFGEQGGPVILSLMAQATSLRDLTTKMQDAGGSAAEMAGIMRDNLKGEADELTGAIETVRIALGTGMEPALRSATIELTRFFQDQAGSAEEFGRTLGGVVATAVDLFLKLANSATFLTTAFEVLIAVQILIWLPALISALLKAIATFQAWTAASASAGTATGILAGTVASLGTTTSVVSPILSQYGAQIVTVTTETNAATVAQSRFLTAGITPLGLALGLLAGGLLYVANSYKEMADEGQAAIEDMIDANTRFIQSLQDLKNEASDLNSIFDKAEEFQYQLRAKGIKDPTSPEALQVQAQIDARFNEKDTAALRRHREELANTREEIEDYREALIGARNAEKNLRFASPQEEERARAQAQPGGGLAVDARIRNLDAAREAIAKASEGFIDTNAKANTLKGTIEELNERTGAYVAPARAATAATVSLGSGLGDAEKKALKALEAFQKLNADLESSRDANRDIAAAYGESTAAGMRAEMQADENARANQAAAGVEEQYRDAIKARVREQVQSEREATGSKTIAMLTDQLKAANKLKDALASGKAPAIEEAKRAQDLLGQSIANTTGAADKQKGTIEDLTASLAKVGQENAFTETTSELRHTNDALKEVEKSWDGTVISIERANAVLQINTQITQATIGKTTEETAALAALIAERERLASVFEARMTLGKQEEEVRRLKELSAIKRSDYRTELAYARALKATNTEHEVRSALLTLESRKLVALEALKKEGLSDEALTAKTANTEADFEAMAQRTEAAIRGAAALTDQIDRQEQSLLTATQQWLKFADALDGSLSGVGDEFQDIASGLAAVVRGFVQAAEAGDDMQAKMAGLAAAAQGLYAIADAAGVLDQNVTQGGFGGRGEGNYSAEGAQIGAVVGAIVGAMMAGVGAGAGAAIGSAAGGILGAFVKKGAQEALGELELDTGDITAKINKNEGSLGVVIRELGNRLNEAVKEILDVLGATIGDIPFISVKVRDGIISVWVGNVNARVKEMGEAITFAVTEILKQSNLTGLSDVMRQVLKETDAIDLDQLAKDLEFGQWYERLGLRDAAVMLLDQMAEFRTKFRQAIELGLDTAPIGEWLGRQMEMARNQILGIQESPEEAIRKNAEAFNQQVTLIDAEQQARRADLLVKKALLAAQIELLKAEGVLTKAQFDTRIQTFNVETNLVRAEITMLGSLLQALAAVDAALAAVDIILASLPDLISNEEIDKAIKGLKGAGGGAASEVSNFGDSLRDIVRSALPDAVQAVMELGDKLRDLQKQSRELAEEEERIRKQRRNLEKEKDDPKTKEDDKKRNRRRDRLDEREDENTRLQEDAKIAGQILIDAAKEAIRDPVRDFLTPTMDAGRGTFGLSEWETRRAEITKTFDDAWAANEALIKETGQSAIEFWELNEAEVRALAALAEEVIDSLGSPLEQTRDRMKDLGDAVSALRTGLAEGAISAERFDQAMAELGTAAASEMFGLAADILDQMGRGDDAAAARLAADEIDFMVKVAQINILFQAYMELEAVSDAQKARMNELLGIINDPANRPDFSAPPPTNITKESSGSTASSSEPAWIKLVKDALEQANEWTKAALGPLTKSATDLKERRDELLKAMTDAGITGAVNLPGVGYVNPFDKLSEAYAIQVGAFVDETLASFESLPDIVSQARELRIRLDDMAEALAVLGVSAADAARAEEARQQAIKGFVDDALFDFERLGKSPLALELEDMTEHFKDLATAFTDLGVGADGMARLEAARMAALADFWLRATEGIRTLAEELTASHPRTTAEGSFLAAQAEFRDLQAKAAGGDLAALELLADAASKYEQLAKMYTGGGVGLNEILDEIIGGLNGIANASPEDILGSQLTQLTVLADVNSQSLAVQQDMLAFFRSGGSIVFNPETAKAAASSAAKQNGPSSATPAPGSASASGSSYQTAGAGTPTGAPHEVVCVFADGVSFDSSAICESVEKASRERREEHAAKTKVDAEMLAVGMSERDAVVDLVAEVAALRREMTKRQVRPAGQAN